MITNGVTCDICTAERSGEGRTIPRGGMIPLHHFKDEAALNKHKNRVHGVMAFKHYSRVTVSMKSDLLAWLDETFENRSEAVNDALRAFKEAMA